MSYQSNLISTMYGGSLSAGNASATGTPSAAVAARVEQALALQKGTAAKLNASLNNSQARLSGLGQLQSALAVFQHIADGLGGSGLSTSATSSGKGVLSATTSAASKAGSYEIDVSQLAQQQILTSGQAAAADSKIGTGALATVKVQVGDSTTSIKIDSRNNSLSGIASAFKDAGVDAAVVKSGNGFALQIRSQSGAAQELSFSVTGDASIKNMFSGLQESQKAQDAVLTVDGKQITSAKNSIEGAVPGTTLNLQGKGKTTVAVATDFNQISKNVASFVAGFNALSERLGTLQKGALKGDTALNQVSSQLTQLVQTGGGSSAAKLAEAGLTLDNGKLKLDEKKLKAAIEADPAAVSKLFTNEGRGIADQLGDKIEALTGNSGLIKRETVQVGKEITSLNGKRAELTKALTTQAQALVQLYTQQEQAGNASSLPGYTGPRSLFDFLA